MFKGYFERVKKKKLEKKYRNLLKEAHRLSTINRVLSDKKVAEAERLFDEINK